MTTRPLAVVTGASGGLGYEFARLLAERGHDLVLIARSGAPMEELAQWAEARHGVAVTVLPKDLSHPGAGGEVADELARRDLHADVLINNAGFTQLAPFAESDEQVMLSLLRVNIEALTQLTRRIAPGMVARGRGRIVNLASNAAFQPGPFMACYYASKAYVLNFSIALHEELRDTGVSVTALAPGPVATGFQARAAMENARIVKGRKLPSAAEVAEWGWAEAEKGKPFAVHSARWKFFAFTTRFLPRPTAARLAARTNDTV
ncbi:MAG: SDR family oxidoreductase [Actinomycetota bacterium]